MGSRVLWFLTALTLVLATSTACYAVREVRIDPREDLELSAPEELFHTDGGSLELWNSNSRVLRDANVGAARVTLEPQGLALLKYSDAPQLAYVLEGKGKIGQSFPSDQSVHVRSARKGDVIAIPQGVGHWWYNSDDRRFVVFSVADTSNGVRPGEFDMFYLNGGKSTKEARSVLHGFDEELLSQAWDVDRQVVRQIRESQKDTAIVKVKEDIDIPQDSERDEESEYIYNIDEAKPDIDVKNGGTFKLLTNEDLPILKDVRLSAIRVKLDREALFAPSYTSNAHVLIYITRGSGRIQIVGSDEQLLNSTVREGSLVVVPQFHPDIKKAGRDGLEFVAISTTEKPILSFLAGRNAVERGIPVSVLAASNNVEIEVQQKVLERRQDDAVIFPPREESGTARADAVNKLNSVFFSHFEQMKEAIDKKLHIQL